MTRKEVNGWLRELTNSAKGGRGSHAEARERTVPVSLAPMDWEYGGKPMTYLSGRLYLDGVCIRERKS